MREEDSQIFTTGELDGWWSLDHQWGMCEKEVCLVGDIEGSNFKAESICDFSSEQ